MILRAEGPAATLLTARTEAPRGVRGAFGKVEVLQLTSAELHEGFGIALAELDVATPFELAAALGSWRGRQTSANIRKDRLVRLIERRDLLPCFVGYQDVPGVGILPFMSDGPSGRWSLFFEQDGRMTLVETGSDGALTTTADAELFGDVPALSRPVNAWKSLLFGGFSSARKMVAANDDRRLIPVGRRS